MRLLASLDPAALQRFSFLSPFSHGNVCNLESFRQALSAEEWVCFMSFFFKSSVPSAVFVLLGVSFSKKLVE